MVEDSITQVKISQGRDLSNDSQTRIIPMDIGKLVRPFDPNREKKCYIVADKGPPKVLKQVDCKDIIIIDLGSDDDDEK